MLNLPRMGQKLMVWPMPGRRVQLGERTLDDGGRWLPEGGAMVTWTPFMLEQYGAGDILLHAPPQIVSPPADGETTTDKE